MISRPNIAFSGLTAAGKTTHAKILAESLGYRYVSAMEVMLDIMNMKEQTERIWFSKQTEIDSAREGDQLDMELDRRLKILADTHEGLLFDTWAMGHIYEGPLLRIWLESDQESRTRKCFVSQDKNASLDLGGCRELINKKDNDTRTIFKRLHDFDLFTDMSTYDAIICNTELIPEPSIEASKRGISLFSPVVEDVARYLIDTVTGGKAATQDNIMRKHDPYIVSLKDPWSFR